MPGSALAAANALRRKTAEEISRSAEAVTWMPISTLRVRPGRASRVISPRIVRTSSIRVACSAGASPNRTLATIARGNQEHAHAPISSQARADAHRRYPAASSSAPPRSCPRESGVRSRSPASPPPTQGSGSRSRVAVPPARGTHRGRDECRPRADATPRARAGDWRRSRSQSTGSGQR